MAHSVLFIVSNRRELGNTGQNILGWYLPELCHPLNEFEKAGYTVAFASPSGGDAPVDDKSLELFGNDEVCRRVWGRSDIKAALADTRRIADTDFGLFSTVFIVGGHAPLWDLTNLTVLSDKLAAYWTDGGVIAAVCHGVCALLNVKVAGRPLLAGKEVTSFTNEEELKVPVEIRSAIPFSVEDRLRELGVLYRCADPWQECITGRGTRLLTGQNPASAGPLALAVMQSVDETGEYSGSALRGQVGAPQVAEVGKAAVGGKVQASATAQVQGIPRAVGT